MGSPPRAPLPPPTAAATSSPPPAPAAAAAPPTPLAPGFRFHPTDVELVGYYLMRKIAGLPLRVDAIADVELYKWDPWDLPRHSRLRSRDRQWFFFSALDRKYDSSNRANRATGQGFWKSTGKDRPVVVEGEGAGEGSKKTIGMKKSLVFHAGRCPYGRRTDWVMHEYRLEEDTKTVIGTWGTSYVVCKIFQKSAIGQKKSDDYGAPLLKGEWGDEEEEAQDSAPAAREALPEVLRIAADDGQPEDFEQGTTEAMRSIDQSTISCEVSSTNSNPPSKGILAPGFRFYPTDEELVFYYLKRKVSGLPFRVDVIADVNVYQWSPWDLPSKSCLKLSMLNTEWYFFSTLDRKYAFNRFSHHNNRATVEGYWKSTGMDRPVHSHTEEKIIGMKKTLIFHRGRAPVGKRTDWVMHEYRLEEDEQNSKCVEGKGPSFVLCRIYQKSGVGPRKPRALFGAPFTEEMVEATQALVPDRKALQTPDVVVDTSTIVAIDDAQEQDCVYISDDSEQETREKIYNIGSKVEIAYIREKLPVAWYKATVIKVIDERVLLIEYESMKNDDGALLSEIVSTQYIRPLPPPTLEVRNFDLLDEVEAFYNDGWWPGVVAKVNTGSRYNVKFMQWEEEIEFHHTELRFLYDWVDGQWIQASQDKSIESQHLAGPMSVGHMQSSGSSNTARDCKFPDSATPPRDCGDEAPSTNYENENSERLTLHSELEGLRPYKKAKIDEKTDENTRSLDSRSTETSSAVKTGFDVRTPIIEEEPNFRIKALTVKCCSTSPFKKIDVASVDSITRPSSNSLSGEANESTLMPDQFSQGQALFHKPLSCNGEENLKCISEKSEFFPVRKYRGGWWSMVDSQQRKEIVPELNHQGDKGARLLTAGEKRRKNCRSQKLTIIEPSLEGDSMRNHDGNKVAETPSGGLSAAQCVASSDNGSEVRGLFNVMTSSSDASLVETSASSGRPSEPGSEAKNRMLLSTVGKQSAKRAFNGKAGYSPLEQSPLPFEKSSMWDTFESKKVFCVMPQQPHFRPLENFCRDFREGMAIGLMVTFSKVVNDISKLEIGDSREKFDGILKALAHLEEHGFSVQSIRARLAQLLMLKEDQDRLADERSTLKALLEKETREKETLDAEIESVEKASTGLEQSLEHLYEEKAGFSEQRRENESKLNRLETDSKRLEDALISAEHDFEATRSALW